MPETAPLLTSAPEIERYLAMLYPDAPDDAWLVVSWLAGPGDFRSKWFLVSQHDDIIAFLLEYAQTSSVYVGLGLRDSRCTPTPGTRGSSTDVWAIGGLWIELDHNEGIHAAVNLPTLAELCHFIKTFPFRFSLLIDSGGGFHAYLLFKELWILDTPAEHQKAAVLLHRFQRTIQLQATAHGWHVDSTTDLARVLRPAGTMNHKYGTPKPVSILEDLGTRFNPSEIEEAPWLATIEETYTPTTQNGTFPPASLDAAVAGCAWLQHCRDDAATLTEPEWYAMLSIVGRCEEGTQHAHAWSAPYPGYSATETDAKLQHALDAASARTCSSIRYSLNADSSCRTCRSWGKVKSPIVLGMAKTSAAHKNGTAGHWPDPTAPQGKRLPQDPEENAAWYQEDIVPYVNKRQIVEANDTTIMTFLQNHSYWQGKLWWDDMANKPMFEQGELTDYLVTDIGAIFGKKHKLPIRTDRMLMRCLAACCYKRKHDPLQAWLQSLPGWDGMSRLEGWLEECAGVVSTAYHRFISRILPVSMIARAFDPGCLYRNVIVFEGPEEYRKSSFVANLVPLKQWHLSLTSSFENKDVPMLIQGIWIAELSELDSLSRTEETRLKSFISETEDAYVPKWQLFRIAPKRRTIFIGTTNESNWLKSATGNTRFFPVRILHPMDVEHLISIREQLLAEAMVWYGDHRATWWDIPTDAQAQAIAEREDRRQASVYEADLGPWLETGRFEAARLPGATTTPRQGETTWMEIATGFLRMDTPEKWKDINAQKQITQALKALGWRQKILKRDGKNLRVWCQEPAPPF